VAEGSEAEEKRPERPVPQESNRNGRGRDRARMPFLRETGKTMSDEEEYPAMILARETNTG